MIKKGEIKNILIAFAAGIIFFALQSWSTPKAFIYSVKAPFYTSDTVVYTAYNRMIDSLADLNLSRDSLGRMGLSNRVLASIDSLYKADSIAAIKVYTPQELKKMRRDSIRNYRDSVIGATPRVLTTYVFPDSVINTRIFSFKHDPFVNATSLLKMDTSFNYHFHDLPFYREDVGAQYLGVSGSAALPFNYFKREKEEVFPFFDPYLTYTYLPSTLPFYNTKTPYTELAYYGNLFSNREKAEDNMKFLHTQNFTPKFNFSILYQRNGAAGRLAKEKTDFRTLAITGNYLGEKYHAEGGYIFSRLKRTENGGVSDLTQVLDTTIDAKTIPIYLSHASALSRIKRNTFFLTHTYGVPIRWRKGDTLSNDEGTVTFFGHYFEYTSYSRVYQDAVSRQDSLASALYHNNFYINPSATFDSVRVAKLENRIFLKIQPWSREAIVSNINGGLGYQALNIYEFQPHLFLSGNKNKNYNNFFTYFGGGGKLKRYFDWKAGGKLWLSGYYKGGIELDASMRFSSWKVEEGIHLTAKFSTSMKKPSYFFNHYYSNHYIWENSYDKTKETKIEALIEIPHWGVEAGFGYSLLNKNIYFDTLSLPKQNNSAMSVISGYVSKGFKIGVLHLDNRVLFQFCSDEDILPLPKLALDLRYYLQFYAVKNVLNLQIGADITYNSKYYAQAYSPATGFFYNQKIKKFGSTPKIDAFINLQWKRACIFVKLENVAIGWPNRDYFSAYGYLKPDSALKIGIWWPFYIR